MGPVTQVGQWRAGSSGSHGSFLYITPGFQSHPPSRYSEQLQIKLYSFCCPCTLPSPHLQSESPSCCVSRPLLGQADVGYPCRGSELIFNIPIGTTCTFLYREFSGIPDLVIAKRLPEFLKPSLLQVMSV